MNFRHGTEKTMKKMQDISLRSTVWDGRHARGAYLFDEWGLN